MSSWCLFYFLRAVGLRERRGRALCFTLQVYSSIFLTADLKSMPGLGQSGLLAACRKLFCYPLATMVRNLHQILTINLSVAGTYLSVFAPVLPLIKTALLLFGAFRKHSTLGFLFSNHAHRPCSCSFPGSLSISSVHVFA